MVQVSVIMDINVTNMIIVSVILTLRFKKADAPGK